MPYPTIARVGFELSRSRIGSLAAGRFDGSKQGIAATNELARMTDTGLGKRVLRRCIGELSAPRSIVGALDTTHASTFNQTRCASYSSLWQSCSQQDLNVRFFTALIRRLVSRCLSAYASMPQGRGPQVCKNFFS